MTIEMIILYYGKQKKNNALISSSDSSFNLKLLKFAI